MEVEKFSFSYTGLGYDKERPFEYLFTHSVYLYANPKGLDIKIPVEYLPKIEAAEANIEDKVSINGYNFYIRFKVLHMVDKDEILFGKSTRFSFYKDGNLRLHYNLTGTLSERICDQKFMLAILENQQISMGDTDIPLPIAKDEFGTFDVQGLKDNLRYLQEVKEVLDELKVTLELNCSDLSEKDEKLIQMLLVAIKYNKPVRFGGNDHIPLVAKMHISNLTLILTYEKLENNEYIIRELSKCAKWSFRIEDVDGNQFPSSVYTILNKDDFCEVCNIDFEDMWSSIVAVQESDLYLQRINILLLQMLAAYDENALQKDKLFEVAIRIAQFLRSKQIFSKEISTLNYLQIIKRKNKLSSDNIDELIELIQTPTQDVSILIGAYLLMDNQTLAKHYFEKLAPEKQEKFKEFPISKFIQF